jgi:hypothetical protein
VNNFEVVFRSTFINIKHKFNFSGSNDKSPNSFSYNDSYETSPVPSSSLQQSLSANGDYPLHGLSLDQQAAYLHGLGVQFTSGFHSLDKR